MVTGSQSHVWSGPYAVNSWIVKELVFRLRRCAFATLLRQFAKVVGVGVEPPCYSERTHWLSHASMLSPPTTLLNDVGLQDIIVGCWELSFNLKLHAQFFEHPIVKLRGFTKRDLGQIPLDSQFFGSGKSKDRSWPFTRPAYLYNQVQQWVMLCPVIACSYTKYCN